MKPADAVQRRFKRFNSVNRVQAAEKDIRPRPPFPDMYDVTLPPEAGDPDRWLHMLLTRFCPGVEAPRAVWADILKWESDLQAAFDRFPEELRELVQSGALLLDDGAIPDPVLSGRGVGEKINTRMVAYHLVDRRMVMIHLEPMAAA